MATPRRFAVARNLYMTLRFALARLACAGAALPCVARLLANRHVTLSVTLPYTRVCAYTCCRAYRWPGGYAAAARAQRFARRRAFTAYAAHNAYRVTPWQNFLQAWLRGVFSYDAALSVA